MAVTECNYFDNGGDTINPQLVDFVYGGASPKTIPQSGTLTPNKKYLLLTWQDSGSAQPYATVDITSMTGGTYTKIGNLRTTNATVYGTFSLVVPSATSITVTCGGSFNYDIIQLD